MLETLSQEEFVTMALTLWAIWYARRKIIFDGKFQSPLSTHAFVESYLRDISLSSTRLVRQKGVGVRPTNPRWIPPGHGFAKINVDDVVSKTEKREALGVVCRSDDGTFIEASAMAVNGISDPVTLEAMACREALALAADLQLATSLCGGIRLPASHQ
jgi:hypothetical protein